MTKRFGWSRVLAPLTVLALGVTGAAAQAQLKPWPDQQQPQAPQERAWPGEARPGGAQPAAVQPAPMAAPPMMAPGGMGMGAPSGGPPGGNPCMAEFTRLRGEVEKSGKLAKAVNDRKGTREEFCKAITALHASQVKWVKYTQDNAKSCGIPAEVLTQLKGGQANLGKLRTNICNGGATAGGGPAAAPSLSEALGTSRMQSTDEAPKRRGGTLDTLTGEPIR